MIEWGCKYRLLKSQVTGYPGNWSWAPAESRAEAELDVVHFNSAKTGWEAVLAWRTEGVRPGEWQDWAQPEPKTPGENDDLTPQVVSDILSLAGCIVPPEVIALWTEDERVLAATWASAVHLNASDHEDVEPGTKPGLVSRAEEICDSPVQAQLALEAWAGRSGDSAWMMNPASVARMAREALTGLVVLHFAARWPASVPE